MIIISKFPGRCRKCQGPIRVGESIVWERGSQPEHTFTDDCQAATVEVAPVVVAPVLDLRSIRTFVLAARERGLKWPSVHFLGPDGRPSLTLSLAGDTSKNPGGLYVKVDGEYQGTVTATGEVRGALVRNVDLQQTLTTIATDPAIAAKAYAQVTGTCSFCSKDLTDDGSIEVGYGPICARRYGLPHTPKGTGRYRPVVEDPEPLDVDPVQTTGEERVQDRMVRMSAVEMRRRLGLGYEQVLDSVD